MSTVAKTMIKEGLYKKPNYMPFISNYFFMSNCKSYYKSYPRSSNMYSNKPPHFLWMVYIYNVLESKSSTLG